MRVAYFGLPLGACLLLEDGHELELAVLSPLEAPGRKRLLRLLGDARVIDALSANPGMDAEIERRLEAAPPDLIVSWFWTRKLPARLLELARLGGINAHPSLLPRHRGPNPYFWAIDSGDRETGVTIHRLTEGYDEGNVLLSSTLVIGERNAWQLARALDRPALALLREAAGRLRRGEPLPETSQDETLANWAPEPSGDELRAAFDWPVERVLRRVRALSPVPGLALEVADLSFFVTAARPAPAFPAALLPGEAALGRGGELLIRYGDGALEVEQAVAGVNPSLPELEEGTELDQRSLGRLVRERLTRARSRAE
jgi:methionyl-tRNA formyltransferase